MAHNTLLTALRAPRAVSVQLPLFLVPSFAGGVAPTPPSCNRPRSYAQHAKMPKVLPKNKRDPLADPNASRKHLKADFPMTTRKTKRDMNRKRGVSAMRSTGPRQALSVSKWPLPEPVQDPELLKEKRNHPQFDSRGTAENHGLWAFFYDKKAMIPPEAMGAHGREWTYAEVAKKSFEDLHALYWLAHKERNRVLTNAAERRRLHAGYGDNEDETRSNTVEETMKNILDVLRDRYESTEEAYRITDANFIADLPLDDTIQYVEDWSQIDARPIEVNTAVASQPAQDPPTKIKFE